MQESTLSLRAWVETYCAERDLQKSSRKQYGYIVNRFEAWAGGPLSLAEACERFNEYVAARCEAGSRYTAKGHRGTLGVLLREADRRGLCVLPKRIRSVRTNELQPEGFTGAELEALMKHADPFQKAMLSVGFDTGLRHADLALLRWSQVDENQMVIRLVQSKPGSRLTAPISEESLAICRRLKRADDQRLIPMPFGRAGFYRRWRRLGALAGVDVFRRCMQATRRTASTLIARKHGEAAAAAFLGHSRATGLSVFLRFYRVGGLMDERPPGPSREFMRPTEQPPPAPSPAPAPDSPAAPAAS